ncbi:MAG: hypothetical protein HY547_07905 [Elusimicrobia bacterium]|nr:hypothetical protein [Elusimicrobiota bacterium]
MKKPRPEKRAVPIRGTLAGLLKTNPFLIKILDRHGVHFCAGCFITLTAPLEKAAAYHAVPNIPKFLNDLKKAAGNKASGCKL